MTEEENNYYVLEEEEQEEIEVSPLNYAAYIEEEEEIEEINEKNKIRIFPLLLKIMFNPVEGWKKLRRNNIEIEKLQSSCFYPLLAILAVCNFADFFYNVNATLSEVITKSVISFVSFFLSYFCIQMTLSWFLPKDMTEKFETKFGKEYILVSLSTLTLFAIFTEILPMLWPILIFLPIWTLYLQFKAVRFFKFKRNQEMKFYIISGIIIIGLPVAIDWTLNAIV